MRVIGDAWSIRSSRIARLAAPLLLCTSAPPAPTPRPEASIGKLAASLHEEGITLPDSLQAALRDAWDVGWREQAAEIDALDRQLADGDDGDDETTLDLQQLFKDSANATEFTAVQRVDSARSVARDLLRFWRFSTPRSDRLKARLDEIDDEDLSELVSSESVSRDEALKQRRRQLARHAAAGAVEYRIFGEVIARDTAVLDALPDVEMKTFIEACTALGATFNLTGFAAQLDETEAEQEAQQQAEQEEAREFLRQFGVNDEDLNRTMNAEKERLREDIRNIDPQNALAEESEDERTSPCAAVPSLPHAH